MLPKVVLFLSRWRWRRDIYYSLFSQRVGNTFTMCRFQISDLREEQTKNYVQNSFLNYGQVKKAFVFECVNEQKKTSNVCIFQKW